MNLSYFRGADPNDPGPKGVTPLMIACKHGRDENVKELLAMEDQNISDMEDDHEDVIKKPRVAIDVKNKHTKAAIHYAAKSGHLVCKHCYCRWLCMLVSGRYLVA